MKLRLFFIYLIVVISFHVKADTSIKCEHCLPLKDKQSNNNVFLSFNENLTHEFVANIRLNITHSSKLHLPNSMFSTWIETSPEMAGEHKNHLYPTHITHGIDLKPLDHQKKSYPLQIPQQFSIHCDKGHPHSTIHFQVKSPNNHSKPLVFDLPATQAMQDFMANRKNTLHQPQIRFDYDVLSTSKTCTCHSCFVSIIPTKIEVFDHSNRKMSFIHFK